MSDRTPLIIQDAHILFRNFAGRERDFNSAGDRNFCVLLDKELGAILERDGWNVKYLKPREEGEDPRPYLHVKVEYGKGRPPRVLLITSKNKQDLGMDQIEMLDWIDIKHVDLTINPYYWDVNGKQGVKAYLRSIFVTIHEDELDQKYADIPSIGSMDDSEGSNNE